MALLSLYLLQAALGAATIWSDFASAVRSVHLLVGAAVWALAVALLARAQYVPDAVAAGETSHA